MGAFDTGVAEKPTEFFGFTEDANHRRMKHESHFGRIRRKKSIRTRKLCVRPGAKISRVHKFGPNTALAIMPSFSKILMEISWRFAVGAAPSLRIKRVRCTVDRCDDKRD